MPATSKPISIGAAPPEPVSQQPLSLLPPPPLPLLPSIPFPPSDIPSGVESYSQARAADDIVDVRDAAGIHKAHVVGLSMGGFAALHVALRHPNRVLSCVAAGAGYGAEKAHEDYFKGISEQVAKNFQERGAKDFAPTYAEGASRVQTIAGDTWDKLEKVFEDRVAKSLARLGVHTQSDVEQLSARVDALAEAVNALIRAQGGKPTARRPAPGERIATSTAKRAVRTAKVAAKSASNAARTAGKGVRVARKAAKVAPGK